jgi:hypothetical protein
VDVVAMVGLARSVEEEAPALAADLGLTTYETAMMLRAPPPVIVLRSDDRARTLDVLGRIRSRGHIAVACDLEQVVSSEDMFRPKAFRFEHGDLVGVGNGEERRLALADVFALLRANHVTRTEDIVKSRERKLSLGRAALTGGVLMTRATEREQKRVIHEREAVLYVFGIDGVPWLLLSTYMRYDGLAQDMRPSKTENFEVLIRTLREQAPSAVFDTRLLSVRPPPNTLVTAGTTRLSASSSGTIDILAHVIVTSLGRAARPYR